MHTYIYNMYIYIYMHIHTYIHIYLYIEREIYVWILLVLSRLGARGRSPKSHKLARIVMRHYPSQILML